MKKYVLDHASNDVTISDLHQKISLTEPRFTFFVFDHEFKDEKQNPTLFVYSAPGKAKVKTKMIYSSCKSAFLSMSKEFKIHIDRSIEVTDVADDLTEKDIFNHFHPVEEKEEKISKPKPKGRTNKTKTNFKDFLNE